MPYNETLAARIRELLAGHQQVDELSMMGGWCIMYKEKMLVGVMNDELMCRVDPLLIPELIEKPGCRLMDMGARTMKSYILVDETALGRQQDLEYWLGLALAYNERAKASRKRTKS